MQYTAGRERQGEADRGGEVVRRYQVHRPLVGHGLQDRAGRCADSHDRGERSPRDRHQKIRQSREGTCVLILNAKVKCRL